jgi:hypothetical protein
MMPEIELAAKIRDCATELANWCSGNVLHLYVVESGLVRVSGEDLLRFLVSLLTFSTPEILSQTTTASLQVSFPIRDASLS